MQKKNCVKCDHGKSLNHPNVDTRVCMHPDVNNAPCPLQEASMAKAFAAVLLKLVYERRHMLPENACIFCGAIIINDIDGIIDKWHEGDSDLSLHEFIGITYNQYKEYVKNPSNELHKKDCPVPAIKDYYDA